MAQNLRLDQVWKDLNKCFLDDGTMEITKTEQPSLNPLPDVSSLPKQDLATPVHSSAWGGSDEVTWADRPHCPLEKQGCSPAPALPGPADLTGPFHFFQTLVLPSL